MSKIQKTHFADDDTLKHIAKLEADNKELMEALGVVAKYAAQEIGAPFNECVSGPIGSARALLAKHGG